MRNRPEISRKRTPRRLACEGGALVNRGLRELRSKQLDYPKAAASLVRQVKQRGASGSAVARIVMPQRSGAEVEATLANLAGTVDVRFSPDLIPAFLDDLERLDTRTVLAFLGEGIPPASPAHEMLARSLVAHSRAAEDRLVQRLLARAGDELESGDPRRVLYGEPLVVEERPGRAFPLALDEASTKQQIKKWSARVGKNAKAQMEDREHRAPTPVDQGFGVGAILLGPASDEAQPARAKERYLGVASIDVDFGTEAMDLSIAHDLGGVASAWLQEIGAPRLAAMKSSYIAVPSLAVSALFADAASSDTVVRAPDLLLGWQASLSLVEMLAIAPLPAIFVYTGRFPVVHVVAAWS